MNVDAYISSCWSNMHTLSLKEELLPKGRVALIVGWSLLTDFVAIKRAGVPIIRSLNILYPLKKHSLELLDSSRK